jgi:hypothetical protein
LIGVFVFPHSVFAQCPEKIVWSKASPERSIVYQRTGDQARILVCELKLVETTDPEGRLSVTREMAECAPINPEESAYASAELEADAEYLTNHKRWNKLGGIARDTTLAFFVALGFTQVGQAIARANARIGTAGGKLAARMGRRARCAATLMDQVLGMGRTGFVAGSRSVGTDRNLRFFPAYIGTGIGLGWTVVNEVRHGDYQREQMMARSLDANRVGGEGCEPVELDMRVEDYADLVREALRLAREHRLQLLRESQKLQPESREWLRERALETAPVSRKSGSTED